MTFQIQIDSVSYQHKPESRDVIRIKQSIGHSAPVTMTPDSFKEAMQQGKSFTPAVLQGSKAEDWREQQLFCVDIDNEDKTAHRHKRNGASAASPKDGMCSKGEKRRAEHPLTVEEVLQRCSDWGLHPFLIYETFSSSPEWQKFRIAFTAPQPITNGAERDRVQLALMELFPECDTACKNRDRLFYGGKAVLYFDGGAVLDMQAVNMIGAAMTKQQPSGVLDWNSEIGGSRGSLLPMPSGNDIGTPNGLMLGVPDRLQELKQSFDFLGYIQSFGGKEKRAGRCISFNPCPICGHKDDFFFYPDTNTFYCFGASGEVGGSIIDFLMHREHIDKTQAIEKFKYELCGLSRTEDKAEMRENRMLRKAEKAGHEVQNGLPPYIYQKVKMDGSVEWKVSAPLLTEFIRKNSHYIFVRDMASEKARRYWYQDSRYGNPERIVGFRFRLVKWVVYVGI